MPTTNDSSYGDLLTAAKDLVSQIRELHGESSLIDEDIEQGEPFATLCAAITKAKEFGVA